MDEDSRNRVAVVNRAALKALGYTQCEGAMLVDEMMIRNVPDFPALPIVAVIDDYYDGLVITGAPLDFVDYEDVDYWDEICEIMEWS